MFESILGNDSIKTMLKQAINHNKDELLTRDKEENKGFITVIERENRILKYIKENL